MSKADIDVTIERIAAATRESTIAVFNYPKTKDGKQFYLKWVRKFPLNTGLNGIKS